jgi:hypothetical protein
MSKKKVREVRTVWHVSDTGCVPLWEITVELRGRVKRYTKETKRKKVYRKRKKVRRTILLIKDSLSNKI